MDYYIDDKGRKYEVNPHTGERSKTPVATAPEETGGVDSPQETINKDED